MATITIREYANIAIPSSAAVQAVQEPKIADNPVTTSGTSAQSAAFNANTRLIAISTQGTQAVAFEIGENPTASATTSLRLPAGGLYFFGVKPGHKIALIDV